jgi:hypothetical protein
MVFVTGAIVVVAVMISKPTYLTCQITTIGLKVDEQYNYWPEMTQFWFETKSGVRILYLRSLVSNLKYLRFIINPADEEEVKTTIGKYLLYKKPYQNQFEKMVDTVRDKIPLNFDLF